MELIIRRYQQADHHAVCELHNKALKAANAHFGNGKWDDDMKDVEGIYLLPGGEFLVGTINDQIVAMGALRKMSEQKAEIKRMRVEPELQGRGYGQAIISQLEQRARKLGFIELQLDTMVIQVAAQRLYEKNGFREFRRATLGGHECIFYEKKLV